MKKFIFILLLPVLSRISLNTLSIMVEKKHYISAIYIGWSKKTDTTLISYECQSGLPSPMKLHSRQFQYVFTQRIKSQMNLTKNRETNARCLIKRCVWKLNIALLKMLNNCSKCLICTSTVLRTSFNTHFLCGIAYPYLPSLCELYISCLIIPSGIWQFLQSFLVNSMKIWLQSTSFSLKQLLESPVVGQTLSAECESHCSYFSWITPV